MRDYLFNLNLQLFGEGGDGGAGGDGAVGGETSGVEIPSVIPERARKNYKEAVEKHTPTVQKEEAPTTTEPQEGAKKATYAELIKSDDYKEEHEAYMAKTIGDRLKKYKGVEAQNAQMLGLLETVASKYGVDTTAENFLESLAEKVNADDSYYESYAMEHDISPEEARKLVTMERKVQMMEAQEKERQRQEALRQHMMVLQRNAEKTKARFPGFDLESEMKDEKFRQLCLQTNGDTTAAYMACHWESVMSGAVQNAAQQITSQTAQAVAANKARPVENGISGSVAAVTTKEDFSKMSLEQLRAYADAERRKKRQGS
ncbi:MAG: hypothetical protein IKB07_08195 [Lachnospiraceae bacterium]|nr:hypothetical protein [Lachnospiraceae bacterium]